jgi:two-component system C4-dicarboxylate transport sensor histidine kinase DctB
MEKSVRKQIDIHLMTTKHEAELRIADSGQGIDPKSMEKLFEPFFTTKDAGKGLGLGLSISARIISEFDGTLRATANESGGATFIVCLPLYQSNRDLCQ